MAIANDKIKVGQFIGRRKADPDDPEDLLAPGGNILPENSFLEQYKPEIVLSRPAPVPFQPAPELSTPHSPPLMAAPTLSIPSEIVRPQGPEPTYTRPANHTPTFSEPAPHAPAAGPSSTPNPPPFLGSVTRTDYDNDRDLTDPVVDVPVFNRHSDNLPPAPASSGEPPRHVAADPVVVEVGVAPFTEKPIQKAPDLAGTDFPPSARDQIRGALNTLQSLDNGDNAEKNAIDIAEVQGRPAKPVQIEDGQNRFTSEDQYVPYAGFPVHTQGDHLLDPVAVARQTANVYRDKVKVGMFLAVESGLQAMSREGKIINPTAVPVPIPGLELVNPRAATEIFATRKVAGQVAEADDVHLQLSRGTYNRTYASDDIVYPHSVVAGGSAGMPANPVVGAQSQNRSLVAGVPTSPLSPIVEEAIKARNRYSDYGDRKYEDGPATKLEELNKLHLSDPKTGEAKVTDRIVKMFLPSSVTSAYLHEAVPAASVKEDAFQLGESVVLSSKKSAKSSGLSVRLKGENKHGFTTDPKLPLGDAYVPLSFTDLRPLGGGKKFRTVYFRPFITNLGESFSPQWNLQNYFGRTDQVATYMSTGRTINLGFQLVAMSPKDTRDIYKKLHWLTSMVYPEIDSSLIMRSGPVTRLRIGNVIDSSGAAYGHRGLPGIIQSLDYDYSDAIWELDKDYQVPRNVNVSISFLVLHDKPMGVGHLGKFGGIGSIGDNGYVPPKAEVDRDGTSKLANIDDGMSFRAVGSADSQLQTYDNVESLKEGE